MTGLSQIQSNGLKQQGGYSRSNISSRQVSVNAYEHLQAGLTIQTREGDVVTLSAERFSELNGSDYTRQGGIAGEKGQISAAYNQREITLSSGEIFSFSVEGDLSEAELEDIESIVAGIDEIIGEVTEGDMDDAVAAALSMGSFDSISRYEADISFQQSYEVYAQTRTAAYGPMPGMAPGMAPDLMAGPEHGQGMAPPPPEGGKPSLLDQMAEFLASRKDESVARARQPLSQLLDHHLAALGKPDDPDNGNDKGASPLYTALKSAGERMDQMINTMIRDMFENTLNHMV